jgi:hypothetical protein
MTDQFIQYSGLAYSRQRIFQWRTATKENHTKLWEEFTIVGAVLNI